MKRISIIIVIILVLLVALILAKNIIAKAAVSAGVEAITGLKLSMKSMNAGIFKTLIGIKELKLYNPSGFPDKLMIIMPEIYIDYDLGAFLKKKVHLQEVRLNLKDLIVVKNEENELNLNTLNIVKAKKSQKPTQEKTKEKEKEKEKAKMPEIQIDELKLKIGKVIYKDYSGGSPPVVKEFNINIDAHYKNITDLNALGRLIIVKAITNTTITSLANFDLGPLKEGVTQIIGKTVETTKEISMEIKETTEEVVEKAADTIKNILPFGEAELE